MNHLENSSINSYNPSWFVISLPEIDIKEIAGEIDFESMTPKELGIYAHEYTHYIQNICTANGLKSSLLSYIYFEQLLIHANKSDYLEIPIKSFPEWESKADLDRMYSICRGSSSDENLDFDSYNLLIEKLKIGSLNETKIVKVEFFKNKIKFKEVNFGVLCVKEGMAIPSFTHNTPKLTSLNFILFLKNSTFTILVSFKDPIFNFSIRRLYESKSKFSSLLEPLQILYILSKSAFDSHSGKLLIGISR